MITDNGIFPRFYVYQPHKRIFPAKTLLFFTIENANHG